MNILITDDEEFMREEMKSAVERVLPGNTFFMAQDYDSAIAIINEQNIDIAFLDINMPGLSGIEVAKTIKRTSPATNIIMATAYEEYALNALRLFVSGYILKPVMDDELREVLDNLRIPVEETERKVTVKCFGNFDIYVNGKALSFSRQKEKELLAYLICLNGASANRAEICANLFEDKPIDKGNEYLKKIVQALKKDLEKHKLGELLIHNRNSYAINKGMLDCDYYNYLERVPGSADTYHGEFLNQYSWAEVYIYELENY
ncbi:MAG: response regulator [Lachnospiraceae bacterium]|nr:response regulator [Lachnospiraceae bacterium]